MISVYFEGTEYNNLSANSVFGWLNTDQIVFVTFVYGLVCGVAGSIGGTFVVKYFSLIPMMNLYLMRPIISQFIGIKMGIDNIPGIMSFVGISGIIGSILL